MSSTRSPLERARARRPTRAAAPASRPSRTGAPRAAELVRVRGGGSTTAGTAGRGWSRRRAGCDERAPLAEVLDGRRRWRRARSARSGCGRPTPASSTSSTVCSAIHASMVGASARALEEELRVLGPLGVARPSRRSRATAGPCRTPSPTSPSLAAPTPGRRDEPALAHRPAELVVERHRVVGQARCASASSIDTSTSSPIAHRRAGATRACRWRRRCPRATRRSGRRRGPAAGRAQPRARPTMPPDQRLQRELGGGLVVPRPLEPERRDRRDGQVRVGPEQLGRCEPGVLGHRRTP